MTITKYKATEGRMVYGERASVYFVQKKIEKKMNRKNMENCKMQLKNKQKDSHKVHQLYTHTHVRSRKEKPRLKWSNYQTFSRRAPSSFCFSPCPFLCRLLALWNWLRDFVDGVHQASYPTPAPKQPSRSRKLYVSLPLPISEPLVSVSFARDDVAAIKITMDCNYNKNISVQ